MKTAQIRRRLPAILIALVLLVVPPAAQAAPGGTALVSLNSNGAQGNSDSFGPALSATGRFVAFTSFARNLVNGDTNGDMDVFIRDHLTGETERASVTSNGSQINKRNSTPAISADGRYVAFTSRPSPEALSGSEAVEFGGDILRHDRLTGQALLISSAPGGAHGNGPSYLASISGDGRYVSFVSDSSDLVPGDTNSRTDIFVRDAQGGHTDRVSVASNGAEANDDSDHSVISANGRYVAFDSFAANLVSGDTNGKNDIFVHDRITGQTWRVSAGSTGAQAADDSFSPCISASGRYVGFWSLAANLVNGDTNAAGDVFVHDRFTGETRRVSTASDGTQANAHSLDCALSADGRYVAFESRADNLAGGDTNNANDIFLHDTHSGQTMRVSTAADGSQADGDSYAAALSADGSRVAFDSYATNLVSGDGNAARDVFLHENTIFRSIAAQDGWVLESGEDSGTGGTLNAAAGMLLAGDDDADRQYRAVLSFDTSSLPDGAVITYAELRIRRAGIVGTDPFLTHSNLMVDMRKGPLGGRAALQALDFQAAANTAAAMTIRNHPVSGWYSASLEPADLVSINKTGLTQFRLRFAKGDDDNLSADYLKFYSGNYSGAAWRPVLIVEYGMP